MATLFFGNCSSKEKEEKEECRKKIVFEGYTQSIPGYAPIYIPSTTMDVPCDYNPKPMEVNLKEAENFSYKIISFSHTIDTVQHKAHLKFEIQLNNENNYPIQGLPVLTIKDKRGGITFQKSFSKDISSCNKIDANSSCTFSLDKEYAVKEYETEGKWELIDVNYYIFDFSK